MKTLLPLLLLGLLAISARATEPDGQVPQYMLLSDESGSWADDIKKAKLPDQFLVDYVRVYDLVEAE